ncbi:MAG: FAD:protein FMN transferase [Bacteroidaceae bacterium]|nr:FAD:protein FMN transferase [Bacteroidaceae bacterium]
MKAWQIFFLIFLVAGSIYVINRSTPYKSNSGKTFGTYYNIIYQSDKDLHGNIKATLAKVDGSLSTFNKQSIISAINSNKDIVPDEMFVQVFTIAQDISEKTNGAFDITVAPLVNAWGFGFKQGLPTDSATIDTLRKYVGHTTVSLQNGKITKLHPQTMLDCSAIAKGYGCDAVARTLDEAGVTNYMVEIGGEIVTKGKNDKGKNWAVGINKPIDDATGQNNSLQEIIRISGKSMATSGNYRNFRYDGERKVSHTIDPKSGYPVEHSLLSATVIADDCATADALATAFMVMGLEEAKNYCMNNASIDAFFIYSDDNGNLLTAETEGFKKYKQQ